MLCEFVCWILVCDVWLLVFVVVIGFVILVGVLCEIEVVVGLDIWLIGLWVEFGG